MFKSYTHKKILKKIQIEPSLHKNIDKWERKTYTRGAQHDKKKKLADCMVEGGIEHSLSI